MSTIRITKKFDFETGHALYGYDGKCKNIHGHNYNLFVTLKILRLSHQVEEYKEYIYGSGGDEASIFAEYIIDIYFFGHLKNSC